MEKTDEEEKDGRGDNRMMKASRRVEEKSKDGGREDDEGTRIQYKSVIYSILCVCVI